MKKFSGSMLKAAQKNSGVKTKSLAESCGVSRQAVSAWRQGKQPRREKLAKLAAVLNCELTTLFEEI